MENVFDPTHPDFDPYASIINERIVIDRKRMEEAEVAGLALVFRKSGSAENSQGQLRVVDWANQLEVDTVDVGAMLKELGDEKAQGTAVLAGRLHNDRKKVSVRE